MQILFIMLNLQNSNSEAQYITENILLSLLLHK